MTGTESANRVAEVLHAFARGPAAMGVSQLARDLDLSKAVVHRILRSLVDRDFLVADSETRLYKLGPAAVALGARALRDSDLRSAAIPTLQALRDKIDETTTLTELLGDSRVYLDQFESRRLVRVTVELGQPHPLHAGGSGKTILAFLTAGQQQAILNRGLTRLTSATITDSETLANDLAKIAECGFAVSLGERQQDAGSVAAPVFGVQGDVIGSLSICAPVGRLDRESVRHYSDLITAAGAEVSIRMGYSKAYPGRKQQTLAANFDVGSNDGAIARCPSVVATSPQNGGRVQVLGGTPTFADRTDIAEGAGVAKPALQIGDNR